MPRRSRRGRIGRARVRKTQAPDDDAGFGFDPESDRRIPKFDISAMESGIAGIEGATAPAPELVALGAPPADAAGIQKWNYQLLSTMAYLAMKDPNISNDTRMKRCAQLTTAAARHYPEAAKFDLAQKISRDTETMTTRKRAKAAAKLERRPPAGGAKVIPIRGESG